jgi:hypothetical protein
VANDWDDTARNVGLDAIAALCVRLALHTGDPGGANTANNEVTGGSYARGTCAWDSAAGGSADLSADVDIDVPSGNTITYVSGWNSAGTVRYFKKAVTAQAFAADGVYTVLAASTTIDLATA